MGLFLMSEVPLYGWVSRFLDESDLKMLTVQGRVNLHYLSQWVQLALHKSTPRQIRQLILYFY